jgi:hypothetical protein
MTELDASAQRAARIEAARREAVQQAYRKEIGIDLDDDDDYVILSEYDPFSVGEVREGMRFLVYREGNYQANGTYVWEVSPATVVSLNASGVPKFEWDTPMPRDEAEVRVRFDARDRRRKQAALKAAEPKFLPPGMGGAPRVGSRMLAFPDTTPRRELPPAENEELLAIPATATRTDDRVRLISNETPVPGIPKPVVLDAQPSEEERRKERSRNRWVGYQVFLGFVILMIYSYFVGNAPGVPGGLFALGFFAIIGITALFATLAYKFPTATKVGAVIGGAWALHEMSKDVHRALHNTDELHQASDDYAQRQLNPYNGKYE